MMNLLCAIFNHKATISRAFATFEYNKNEVGEIRLCERCNNLFILTTHPENYLMEPTD